MPHKFNADRRDKIRKQRHRVTNWAEYNEGLRRRGDLTVWISCGRHHAEQRVADSRTTLIWQLSWA